MLRIRDFPISRKLICMNMAVSAAALILACLGFVAYDVATFRGSFANFVSSQARIVEANTISALVFDDPAAAQKTLSAFATSSNVRSVALYRLDGGVFASYSRDPKAPLPEPQKLAPYPAEVHSFGLDHVSLQRTIFFDDKAIGYVFFRASLQSLYDRVKRYLGIAVIVLGISMGAALAVSWIFGRAVADPIAHLAEVAGRVSREENYSVRAAATTSHDEVAVLIDSFNGMLSQIQERDSALLAARDQLEVRVRERTAQLAALSGRLMKLQDEERRHIARELHDSTGQIVAALGMNLAVLQGDAESLKPHTLKALEECAQMVQELSRELRTLSHLLHPPLLDVAGLESALKWYVQGFAERSGIRANLHLPAELGRLPRDVETAVFRIVQESLTNVHRHAQSPTATVKITRNGHEVRVEVSDEGRGFQGGPGESSSGPGIGVQGMRERVMQLGGEFEIRSTASGTVVVAQFRDSAA